MLKKYTLIAVTTASFLTPFMGSAVNLAIPSIGNEFSSTAVLLSWVVTSYILASAAFLVPIGRIADIIGRKKIFITGTLIFTITSFLCAAAWSVKILIFFRVLQGVGSAMVFATAMAILTSVFPPWERGKVLGINVASVYTGLSLGPVLGGALNHYLGWEFIFYFSALLGIISLIITIYGIKGEWADSKGESFDINGSILYSVGLIALMYGISSISNTPWAKYTALLGLIILIIFIVYEKKLEHPVLNTKLFSQNITFSFSNLAALVNYSATFAVAFLLSLYLQVVLQYNSQAAGLVLLFQPIIMAVLSPFTGKLSDRIEPRIVASTGMAITFLSLLFFCFIAQNTPLWLIILNLMLLGAGLALFSSPNNNAIMGSVEKKYYGVAASALSTMRLTGQTISMAIVTLIIALYVGNIEFSQASASMLVKGTQTAFIIFTVLCFGGIFASLARGDLKERNAEDDS
ncbi:MAG: MFS transporter [Clostridiales bacterium]|nr:MFS transporter [Clostridiales bacterium]MCF8023622.1 MFS transporter [Clostridiales bacterium]